MAGVFLWDHCKFQLSCIFFSVENYFFYHLFDCVINWEPLQKGAAPGSKPRIPPLGSGTLGFGQKHDATADIPLDTMSVMKLLLALLFLFCSLILLRDLNYVLDGMLYVGFQEQRERACYLGSRS